MVRVGLVGLAIILAASTTLYAGDVRWESSYGGALKAAEKTARPLAIVFGINNRGGTC